MNIYDCFMYFDEDLLLDLRLHTLDKFVKKFVITEATYTHNGSKKELKFNINKFSKFKDKIIYIVVDKQPNDIIELVEKYNAKEVVWAQEEPENMGAWTFILSELRTLGIDVIAREASAATATGSSKNSAAEQNELINKVFKK